MPVPMPIRAKVFIAVTLASGVAVLVTACLHLHSDNTLKFACYLLIAIWASTMKVKLPGMDCTMSVNFLFVLLGVVELSLGETLIIGCIAALVQSVWKSKNRPDPVKVLFNIFSLSSNAIFITYLAYRSSIGLFHDTLPLLLAEAALIYFISNNVLLSIVIGLVEMRPLKNLWCETQFWTFPYNLAGAAVVGVIHFANAHVGWQTSLLILPVMYGIHISFQLYLERLEDQKKRVEIEARQVAAEKHHVEEVCALHLRTIEGLALAIEAKDQITHKHLHRVRTYAVGIGTEMGLSAQELDALRAGALLHDVGKLAVPDHIINKPGRLTPEEFEKMKIHPIIGADILERVAFPYPVAPIVRAHHEKWNGSGYPDGLKGEDIPIGARILAAVDCLDALASDRQYRRALPLDEAMRIVADGAGTSFDPRVVEVLQRRYSELENYALRSLEEEGEDSFSFRYKVPRGVRPATGFELDLKNRTASPTDFLSSIASARQEAYTLYELSQDLGNSLSLDETLSLVAMRLRKLVPYDSIVAFIKKDDVLVPEFVSGTNFRLLSSLIVPVGAGLCGWVAQNAKPIVNGDPAVETGFVRDPKKTELRSALVVPLEGPGGLVGVLALYRDEKDAFTTDHLRVLQVITSKVAMFIENALKYRQAEKSATLDYLTGLPNVRALSVQLDMELARAEREGSTIAVMVCDLDGFKTINDRHGHLTGDKVLRLFADYLRMGCRNYDYVARMGGDEFLIVASNMTPQLVREKTQQLNVLAREAARNICGDDVLSLSLGAAFYPTDGLDAVRLLAQADRNMYAAKNLHYANREPRQPSASERPYLVSVA